MQVYSRSERDNSKGIKSLLFLVHKRTCHQSYLSPTAFLASPSTSNDFTHAMQAHESGQSYRRKINIQCLGSTEDLTSCVVPESWAEWTNENDRDGANGDTVVSRITRTVSVKPVCYRRDRDRTRFIHFSVFQKAMKTILLD